MKALENYEHKAFYKENDIDTDKELSNTLKRKNRAFDKLYQKVKGLEAELAKNYEQQLNDLALELKDDSLDELEDRLENNEVLESPKKPEPKAVKEVEKNGDVEIIKSLLRRGQKSVGRSDLRALGYKGKLEATVHHTGNFKLKKALFSYTYYITPIRNKKDEKD